MGERLKSPELWKAAAFRFVLIGAAWLVLSGGSLSYPLLVLLIVVSATATSLIAIPPGAWNWRPAGMLRFLPFFVHQSILGGFDVSRRALAPHLPVQPGLVTYTLRLPPGPQRVFMVNAINLLPGTVVTTIDGDTLTIHAIDTDLPVQQNLDDLEAQVANLFGVELRG